MLSFYPMIILLLSSHSCTPTLRTAVLIANADVATDCDRPCPILLLLFVWFVLPRVPSSLCRCLVLHGRIGSYLTLPGIHSTPATLPSSSAPDAVWKEGRVLDHMKK